MKPVSLGEQFGFGHVTSLSQGIGFLIPVGLSVAGTAVLIYFIWGAFDLVFSGGDKAKVQAARDKITHAIIGFMLLIFMFVIFQYLPEFLGFNFRVISLPGGR